MAEQRRFLAVWGRAVFVTKNSELHNFCPVPNLFEDGKVRAGNGKRGKFSPKNGTNKKENEKITTKNQSKSKIDVDGEDVAIVAAGAYLLYQGAKWITAVALSGYTGGGSLIGAGVIP